MATVPWCQSIPITATAALRNRSSINPVVAVQEYALAPVRCKLQAVGARLPSENIKQALPIWRLKTGAFGNPKRETAVRAVKQKETGEAWDYQAYQALLHGGEEVSSLMKEMIELLEDITELDTEAEETAVQMAAAAAVGQRMDKLDGSFLVALDWMIKQADTDHDEKRKFLLEIIKDTVLAQLAQKCPGEVQVIGLTCRTPCKEHRLEILRRAAGGGGVFGTESGGKLSIPGANLNDIASQADDILTTMEEKPRVSDRKLLAKLVLVREEARSMMSGGILDKRNDNRGLKSLPQCEVNFLTKLISLRPGPALRQRLSNVLRGKEEGTDFPVEDENSEGRISVSSEKQQGHNERKRTRPLPVRPGMFLEALTKVLSGMYEKKVAGVTVQQLEWIHQQTLQILQEIAFS